jgi:putative phosphoribosyl transferase
MQEELIKIRSGAVEIEGLIELPEHPVGFVLFAHGSGSSRFSPRNRFVADALHDANMGTMLMDLLTREEDQNYQTRFDIALLEHRLNMARDWLRHFHGSQSIPIGLFGSSTGAAAALRLAAKLGKDIKAVVSRGGRPDLAGSLALPLVTAPTLLIVGGDDEVVIGLNQTAYAVMQCEKRLEIIPGATHLFEESGKLEAVAQLAAAWFERYFMMP